MQYEIEVSHAARACWIDDRPNPKASNANKYLNDFFMSVTPRQ
jgi:hypothetical protein